MKTIIKSITSVSLLLFLSFQFQTVDSFAQSQPVDIYGMVESLSYDPVSGDASAMLYVAYDNNYDLPASIMIDMYISHDTLLDSKDIKFTAFNLLPSSFVDSYKRWGPAGVGMKQAESGDWYILMVMDATNTVAEKNEKNNIAHSKKFTVAGGTGIDNASLVLSTEQIYPNPFHDKTIISFSLTQNSQVSIVIHDVLGNEVATVVNQKLQAGTYKDDFEKKNLPAGIYYCTLISGSRTISKKMVIY